MASEFLEKSLSAGTLLGVLVVGNDGHGGRAVLFADGDTNRGDSLRTFLDTHAIGPSMEATAAAGRPDVIDLRESDGTSAPADEAFRGQILIGDINGDGKDEIVQLSSANGNVSMLVYGKERRDGQPADVIDPIFLGGWQAAAGYAFEAAGNRRPGQDRPVDVTGSSSPGWLRDWLDRYRTTRRVNRAFRRSQRDFDHAMDCSAHDPAGQRELQTIWSTRS